MEITLANFQRTKGGKSTRLDKDSSTLVLVLSEAVKFDLAGAPWGTIVGADDESIVMLSEGPVGGKGDTYSVVALSSGTTRITARRVMQSYVKKADERRAWLAAPILASLDVTVFGAEYRQDGGTWGNATYGSTNPMWKDVKWTKMSEAGCGPTSLADVLD